jgi:hypothetical protein
MAKPARPKKDRATDPKTDPAPRPKMTPAEKTLRALALGHPETVEEFPWGERVIASDKLVRARPSHPVLTRLRSPPAEAA